MDLDELKRLGAAAFWAKRICLGPVGELLSRELRSWEEFGYRLGTQGMTIGIVDAVLKARTSSPRRPAELAARIQLLYDGALVGSKATRSEQPIKQAAQLVDELLELALSSRP